MSNLFDLKAFTNMPWFLRVDLQYKFMLPNSPNLVGSLLIQDRKPDHPDRHFKNTYLKRSDIRVKGVLYIILHPIKILHPGLPSS